MKTLLLSVITLLIFNVETTIAQVKTTGVVPLLSNMTAQMDMDNSSSTITLTFTGPATRWFALQFGDFRAGDGMSPGEDLVYANETTLVDAVHNGIGNTPSDDMSNDWTVISNTVASGIRTIVATRAFDTGDTNDFTFDYSMDNIDFAFSRSATASYSLAYHGATNRDYAINNQFQEVLGIDGQAIQVKAIAVVPNPASQVFSVVSTLKQDIVGIQLYNSLGQKVLTVENGKFQNIDISNLAPANYYVELKSSRGEVVIKKLVVK